jgi:hypothetical protein
MRLLTTLSSSLSTVWLQIRTTISKECQSATRPLGSVSHSDRWQKES